MTPGVTGLLAAARDGSDLAEKIARCLDNPDLRTSMANAALGFARGQSWEAIFERLFASYAVLAKRRAARRAA